MTIDQILSGPVADRAHNATHDLTVEEARGFLREWERSGVGMKYRGAGARSVATYAPNITAEARDLYRAYAAAYGA
jgi:hypothetical protein